jgi:Flp pilus assembly protein TadG
MATQRRQSRERGMAIIFYATMLFFVIGCVGLAVDVGTIFMIKARLSAAVDGAALAAGRSVNLADTVADATTNATTTAQQFFSANFPNGYFNSLGIPTVTPTFTQLTDANGNPNGVLNIQVNASVSAPTYFMHMFNVSNITVAATGTASRRGLVMMLVLDQSSSMGSGAGSPCEVMKTAAENFITLFSPFDQIGLVTFDLTAHLMDPPSDPIASVNANIAAIACGSNTNTITALELAYQQIRAANLPLALNSIVLFTDGSPNGITATFPAMWQADNRWGPALSPNPATPAQAGSTYGITNSCASESAGSGGTTDANGIGSNGICVNMPPGCGAAASATTIFGTIAQWGDQNSYGGPTYGFAAPTDTSNVTLSGTCTYYSSSSTNMRQFIAYIPDTDFYGNSLHGVTATSNTGTAAGGVVSRDNWIFQVNNLCSPDPTVNPNCRNTGDFWTKAAYTGIGSGSNFFPNGPNGPPNGVNGQGYFRPDQPNTVVAAAMNGTMAEANKIRSDATYHPVINTLYLTGNATDAVDREFLAIVANAPLITALPYDPVGFVPYTNPAYVTTQETGKYLVTSNRNMLTALFAQLASETLRLSQ